MEAAGDAFMPSFLSISAPISSEHIRKWTNRTRWRRRPLQLDQGALFLKPVEDEAGPKKTHFSRCTKFIPATVQNHKCKDFIDRDWCPVLTASVTKQLCQKHGKIIQAEWILQIRSGFFWVKVDLQTGSGFVRLEPNLADKKRLLQARRGYPGLEVDFLG